MDTGEGKFEQMQADDQKKLLERIKALESQYPDHGGWFREGEIIEIRGSTFRIQAVKPTGLRLKLLRRGKA
ncbi:MAG TPA: hypothetical protein VI755_11740 [Anaerolineales bacterium]|nr:hypothetical protein [Anaerolineales bacterium]